jgi:hypothetical protein
MKASARVETGSLTPTLSRRERASRFPRCNRPRPRPSEPTRLVPARAWLNPLESAANVLLLPPGEGRDEGRPLHSSRYGSWSCNGLKVPETTSTDGAMHVSAPSTRPTRRARCPALRQAGRPPLPIHSGMGYACSISP